MDWKQIQKILLGAAVSYAATKVKDAPKYIRRYQDIQTLNRARREYERKRKKGLSASKALAKVALDTGIPQRELVEFLKDKTGDFGDLPIGDILEGTIYGKEETRHAGSWD